MSGASVSLKRTREDGVSHLPFSDLREKELFETDRNILARVVYKHSYQFRRLRYLGDMKRVVVLCDRFLESSTSEVPRILLAIQRAAEWWFQQLSIGQNLPHALTITACLARLAEILKRIDGSTRASNHFAADDDEGVPVG
jgi:hypothetical protein